ncbi:hypothetical protein F4680DRAFT_445628 [Xylaria scruposa]|nr:hypothetical protein F4680DRAFT_445628 [Xylaria scruposa]
MNNNTNSGNQWLVLTPNPPVLAAPCRPLNRRPFAITYCSVVLSTLASTPAKDTSPPRADLLSGEVRSPRIASPAVAASSPRPPSRIQKNWSVEKTNRLFENVMQRTCIHESECFDYKGFIDRNTIAALLDDLRSLPLPAAASLATASDLLILWPRANRDLPEVSIFAIKWDFEGIGHPIADHPFSMIPALKLATSVSRSYFRFEQFRSMFLLLLLLLAMQLIVYLLLLVDIIDILLEACHQVTGVESFRSSS